MIDTAACPMSRTAESITPTPRLALEEASPASPELGTHVSVHVYDLHKTVLTRALNAVLPSGAFHVGVEVYGRERDYVWKPNRRIAKRTPTKNPNHSFRETVP